MQQAEDEDRTIERTMEIGWSLLAMLPRAELKRVHDEFIEKYHKPREQGENPGRHETEEHEAPRAAQR